MFCIKTQYTLVKNLYATYTDDFDMAGIDPILDYDPFNKNWQHLRKIEPRKHWRQGLLRRTSNRKPEGYFDGK